MKQNNIYRQGKLDLFAGNDLRDLGISRALDNAEIHEENWGKTAYKFLLEYSRSNKVFLAEDVRIASNETVPEPPSNRAWGAIFIQAKKNNLIKKIGYSEVKNPKAHRTPATLWAVV